MKDQGISLIFPKSKDDFLSNLLEKQKALDEANAVLSDFKKEYQKMLETHEALIERVRVAGQTRSDLFKNLRLVHCVRCMGQWYKIGGLTFSVEEGRKLEFPALASKVLRLCLDTRCQFINEP